MKSRVARRLIFPVLPLSAALLLALSVRSESKDDELGTDAYGPVVEAPKRLDPRDYRIGRLIENLSFTDIEGKKGQLSDFAEHKALVIAIRDVGCPLSKKYAPRIRSLQKDFEPRGVAFLMVNLSEGATVEEIRAEIKRYNFSARYVHDSAAAFGNALEARRTTDVFVLDSKRTLVYRGAIDDQYGIGYHRARADKEFLRDALEALLERREIPLSATSAPGCELSIKPLKKAPGTITWHNRISRIVQQNCQECHREGENGPFPLMSYKDVKANRDMIERVVGNRSMPPWFADPKIGQWANDRSLSASDRSALLTWIKQGCAKGDASDAPLPRPWYKGWKLGRPDAVVALPRPISVPAEGVVRYKYVAVPTNFTEDRWVRAVEVRAGEGRAGAPAVVHHVLIFIRYPEGHPRASDQPRVRGGLAGYFAGMVPGQGPSVYPRDTAKFLPKGATFVFQLHYTPNGVATKDQTRLGLYFTDKPKHEFETKGIYNVAFSIPPGAGNHKVTATKRLRKNMQLFAFAPHMHLRGKAFRYDIVKPDGSTETLLNVPRFDFNWQLNYWLQEPLDLPRGTRIRVTAWYDNSDTNPANPNPQARVRFGEQTWDEMLIGYLNWYELPD